MHKYEHLRAQDPFIFKEIFEVNAYHAFENEIKGAVVIDVGANVGMFSLLARDYGAKRVLAFEPQRDNYVKLVENIGGSDWTKNGGIIPIATAVYPNNEFKYPTVHMEGSGGLARVVEGTDEVGNDISTSELHEILDILCKDEGRIVLKMDCEGSEYPILQGASESDLRKFEYIYIEIHGDSGKPENVIERIRQCGFKLGHTHTFFNYVDGKVVGENENKVYKFRRNDIEIPLEVTCIVSTKDRYYSTLPLMLMAICNQTRKPTNLIIYDDGEMKDMREDPLYSHILRLLLHNGIQWYWEPGQRCGQVANHIASLSHNECKGWLWRLDDDNCPEPNVLEILVSNIESDVGAVGGLVIEPRTADRKPSIASNKIEDIYLGMNVQWYLDPFNKTPYVVDHLYSSFIYRKDLAKYPTELSPAGHREETIMTFEILRSGHKCIVDPRAHTWHMRCPTGGIRTYNEQFFAKDEVVFMKKLNGWKVTPNEYAFIVLDNGIGDHFAFKTIIKEYIELNKDKKIILFTCFPEVFEDVPEITQSSIRAAMQLFGNIDRFNIYKWMAEKRWDKSLTQAFAEANGIKYDSQKTPTHGDGSSDTVIISPYSSFPAHAKSYPFWTELVDLLNKNGLRVIQIGRVNEQKIDGVADHVCGMKFSKIADLISRCRTWISVDNFLPHLVNFMDKPVVGHVIFAQSDPLIFGYEYNNNMLKSRKFLRADQFNNWQNVHQRPEFFESARDVLIKIRKYTDLCLSQLKEK